MTHNDTREAQEQAARFATGLYDLADWLTEHDIPVYDKQILHSLHSNAAVEEFAAGLGLTVIYDAEGNASTTIDFGPVSFQAYGFVDFATTRRRLDEREARRFAADHGLELVPAAGALATANG